MLKSLIFGLALTAITLPASAQVVAIAGGIVAKDALAKLNENITNKITMASQSGDYLMEKAARELQLLLANSDTVFKDNVNLTFDKLTVQQQTFLKTALDVSNKLDGLANQVMTIEQFAAMDLNTLLGQIPGVQGDTFLLRRVQGYSHVYRDKGVYQVKFTGQAFLQKRRVKVSINGQAIQLLPFSQDYVAVAEVPVALVNPSFDDKDVKRIKLKVESWEQRGAIKAAIFGAEKKLLDYDTEVLLLPKKPTRLELREIVAGKGWSEETYSSSATALAYATGGNGNWRSYSVSVTIPNGTKMIEERTQSAVVQGVAPGTWGNWSSGYMFSNQGEAGPLTVTRNFAHQIHDQHRTLKIEAFYRRPVVVEGRRLVPLVNTDGAVEAVGLEYDRVYTGTFTPEYAGYIATFVMFNGQRIELTQGMPNEGGIEHQYTDIGGLKKVSVRIRNPYL